MEEEKVVAMATHNEFNETNEKKNADELEITHICPMW